MNEGNEFYYNGIQVELFQRFGWAIKFEYAGMRYESDIDFVSIDIAKETAKQMIDQLLKKQNKSGDELGIGV